MKADIHPGPPEEPSDAASVGELVLGLLPPDEAAALRDRLGREPALQRLHAVWSEALGALLDGPEAAPPAALRGRVEARLFGGAPAPRRRWAAWAGLIGAPAAAAAAAAFLLLAPPAFDPTIHVDIVVPEAGLNVALGADGDTLRIVNVAGTPAPGRAFEVWLVPPDGGAPVSLGLLPESGQVDVPRPEGLATGVVIAVSDEPAGGSPTGAPTGPILGTAPFFDL